MKNVKQGLNFFPMDVNFLTSLEMHTEYLLVERRCVQKTTSTSEDVCKSEQTKTKTKTEKAVAGVAGDCRGGTSSARDEQPAPPAPATAWRFDSKIYLKTLKEAYLALLNDEHYMLRKAHFYPNVDIQLSIEKMISEFWGTHAGWERHKKQKDPEINWKLTFDRQFNYPQNHVKK